MIGALIKHFGLLITIVSPTRMSDSGDEVIFSRLFLLKVLWTHLSHYDTHRDVWGKRVNWV